MTIAAEQLKSGMTRNQNRIEQVRSSVQLTPAEEQFFASISEPIDALVLAEDWCGDVIAGLPILQRLCAASKGKIVPHIFLRDQHLDLADQFLNQGKYRSIPVFAFFDSSGRELGRFIERPPAFNELRERYRAALYTAHPEMGSSEASVDSLTEEQTQARRKLLTELDQELASERTRLTIRDIRTILEGHV
ncbi:MAG: thioredoxin family protein [Chloroflexi bacterium]|nr:thioredoxin family protein [Chloroflexota bacterium]